MVDRLQKRCFRRTTSSQTMRQDRKRPSRRRTSPSLKTPRSMASVAKAEGPACAGWARNGAGTGVSAAKQLRRIKRRTIAIQYPLRPRRPGIQFTHDAAATEPAPRRCHPPSIGSIPAARNAGCVACPRYPWLCFPSPRGGWTAADTPQPQNAPAEAIRCRRSTLPARQNNMSSTPHCDIAPRGVKQSSC